MHPGGHSYATFPVNAFEAESRRLAQFFRIGHTPGPMAVGQTQLDPEFPLTLDFAEELAGFTDGGIILRKLLTPGRTL
jgi:uncharacterized protein (DUF2126 family)